MTPCILLTNDDGHDAAGLIELAQSVASLGEVVVVAPDRERSAASHALTLGRPLRLREMSERWYRVDGTPTDCVHLGVFNLTGGRPPHLLISGINRGLNIGDDVTYSGTVAGALEGALLNVPSIAVSLEVVEGTPPDYSVAARFARSLGERLLGDRLPPGVFLNVNVPALVPPRGARVTRQGTRSYRAAVVERLDPAGRPYYWIAGADMTPSGEPDGDHAAIDAGYVSVTPLHANLTHEPSIRTLAAWGLEVPR